jgi:hypothetical protein
MARKTAPDDAYKVPEGIANFTLEKKKEVARDMLRKTKLNNEQVADITGLQIKSVATMRGHIEGKLKTANEVRLEREHAQELPETGQLDGEPVRLRDIDEKARERRPEPIEGRVTRLESGLHDVISRVNDVDARVGNGFEELKGLMMVREGPREPEREASPSGNGQQVLAAQVPGQEQIRGQFDAITYKIPISSRQVALFEAWRARQNKLARTDPEHWAAFEGDIGDFVTQLAFPEWFKLRGATLVYKEEEVTVEAR